MAARIPLCRYCSKIPLDIKVLRAQGQVSISLGTLRRVQNTDCPFCKLVSSVVFEIIRGSYSTTFQPDTELRLEWWDLLGQGGAFYLPNLPEVHICFGSSGSGDPRVDRAFCLLPTLNDVMDVRRIGHWLSNCQAKHGESCNIKVDSDTSVVDSYPGLDLLRFIDVKQNCIVETRKCSTYIALSYVWGSVMNFRLTSTNKAMLMRPNAIKEVWYHLPRTIQDAISLVRELGEQYLWVDALCLLQNDPQDLEHGVIVMDLVYERALMTILAACGHNADSGLPGVHHSSRPNQSLTVEVAPGIELGVYCMLDRIFKESSHASRAWTLQEQALSRRVLYFVDNRIYFRCKTATYCECIHPYLDDKSCEDGNVSPYYFLHDAMLMQTPAVDYTTIISLYSQRALTNHQDAIRAMNGIIRRFSYRWKCRFLEGMPTAAFDVFILFRGEDLPLHRRPGFPSYSWAGWKGSISFTESFSWDDWWLDGKTWIIWHKRSPNNILSLVWDPLANELFPFDDPEVPGYRKRRSFQSQAQLPFRATRTLPTQDLEPAESLPSYPVLQFWTLSVFYNLNITDPIRGKAILLDKNRVVSGTISLDGLEETKFFESPGPFEVILLSETHIGYGEKNSKSYNVMLLEWSDGMAERRGIGKVDIGSINMSMPPGLTWKEIVLS